MNLMKVYLKDRLGHDRYYALVSLWHRIIGKKSRKPLHWEFYADCPEFDPVLKDMLVNCTTGGISNYWKALTDKNVEQLIQCGFGNFKQTVALNYFTFIEFLNPNHPQVKFLESRVSAEDIALAKSLAATSPKHAFFSLEQSRFYNYATYLFWRYLLLEGAEDILEKVGEPGLGNPLAVAIGQKLFSQDLANSILEYQSITLHGSGFRSVLEIGAGYGRNAHLLLSLHPDLKYIIIDIPPALYISQTYLSEIFKDKKIFRYRNFTDFESVRKEFADAEIIFLTPGQMEQLDAGSVDLCLAVDCLHEMRPERIRDYFNAIARICGGVYFKCRKETKIPFDNIVLTEKDYPLPAGWKKIYSRECRVQVNFFEALYREGS